MTNKTLISYHRQLEQLRIAGNVGYFLMQSKIKEFYNKNQVRINSVIEKMNVLNLEYFRTEKGKPLYDENKNPILLEGKDINEYNTRFDALMNQEINIIL